ncbi:TetR/AcrR family transcriptional regulator [Variovorax boronicumulans]|uniref:TetR/AcrR family transcriptional regulator n=1 Tax=Variovorax boronicumulans TaxID=436515 RepID=UPI0027D827A1|nr:TetR/AcrR family transcriptional regulator [Variovorax boronicumulans]
MGRPRSFDTDTALDAAIHAFAEHGYEGTSAQMLTKALGIGRQSLYDTFGDKRGLYLAALSRYTDANVTRHLAVLRAQKRATKALMELFTQFVQEASDVRACMGVAATVEFGCRDAEVLAINASAAARLVKGLAGVVEVGQRDGEFAGDVDPVEAAHYLVGALSSIRLAARGGASIRSMRGIATLALRALR